MGINFHDLLQISTCRQISSSIGWLLNQKLWSCDVWVFLHALWWSILQWPEKEQLSMLKNALLLLGFWRFLLYKWHGATCTEQGYLWVGTVNTDHIEYKRNKISLDIRCHQRPYMKQSERKLSVHQRKSP